MFPEFTIIGIRFYAANTDVLRAGFIVLNRKIFNRKNC